MLCEKMIFKRNILWKVVVMYILLAFYFPNKAFSSPKVFSEKFIYKKIDALPEEGGVIYLPEGIYLLSKSIKLRDNLHIRGNGRGTILTREKAFTVGLKETAKKGENKIIVADATGFKVDSEITIVESSNKGDLMQAVISAIKGNTLYLDRELKTDYTPQRGGRVANVFPMLLGKIYNSSELNEGCKNIRNITIENLLIKGNIEELEHKYPSRIFHRFNCSAILIIKGVDVLVKDVWIKDYPSDGICLLGGYGNRVENNSILRCLGSGIHIGADITGIKDSIISKNISCYNSEDGIYLCSRVNNCQIVNNIFCSNKGNGIGNLGRSGDVFNMISGNICNDNDLSGIRYFNGERNVVINNICLNNSQGLPDKHPDIFLKSVRKSIITGNICNSLGDENKSHEAIIVEDAENILKNNINFR